MQTGNESIIELVTYFETKYPFMLEQALHNHFKRYKIQDTKEWFEVSDIVELKQYFLDKCKIFENNFDVLKQHDNYYFEKQYNRITKTNKYNNDKYSSSKY